MIDVSVVIPVRNGEGFVAGAIESVIGQEGVSAEAVVVDDGSTDATPAILAGFAGRIVVHSQPGRGLPAARNAGVALARGELVAFLDADDRYPPGYLRRLVDVAKAAPDAGVFHCGVHAVGSDGSVLYEQTSPLDLDRDPFHELVAGGSPHISTLAVRRSAANCVGPFDETLPFQEDWDYMLRLAASGAGFKGVAGNMATIHVRADSMTASIGGRIASATGLAVLEKHLSRHGRCAACERTDAGLAGWRNAVLHASARHYAHRLRLRGRAGRFVGAVFAVVRQPQLAGVAFAELRKRRTGI